MIDREKTKQLFNYYPEDLGKQSHKKIVAICDDCGKEREIQKYNYRALCKACVQKGKKRESLFGADNHFYGKHHTKKSKEKIASDKSIKYSGKNNPNYIDGRKDKEYKCLHCNNVITYETYFFGNKTCKRCSKLGKNNGKYKDGRTPLKLLIRNLPEYANWRLQVFQRDNFKCVRCGSGESGMLEAHHHKKSFATLLEGFLQRYNQFSPVEDKETLVRLAMNYKLFWVTESGETLCKSCHEKTFSKKQD